MNVHSLEVVVVLGQLSVLVVKIGLLVQVRFLVVVAVQVWEDLGQGLNPPRVAVWVDRLDYLTWALNRCKVPWVGPPEYGEFLRPS